ncbi:NtaA/DmoA family FMN-dependent monooxygenase [Xylanimonas protaetiae]|uniref:LLM class flavin-dependent oxidoreductase n=1 Tax=Xylanimonas protaetiae TaxID=2509457 RepID=A0A4V0YGL2_9MICO|nr:NtaA/DmoA family FMN-dependent monooxygenase [Xylanimonas protaetiae]QAY71601.1 LLM class flavin-dependent oxidoreductase [Xylanimonas protaetiae]
MSSATRQVHLAAHFPGVNATTIWTQPESGSQIDPQSFLHLTRAAEAALFDYVFLAEGLRLREFAGGIHDLDVVGRPDSITQLAALAGATEHIGLVATLNTTYNEPYELARQLATLDLVSRGRAGWNVVTSHDTFFGANFRRGGFLDAADRYERAEAFLATAFELWDAAVDGKHVSHHDRFFDVEARLGTPAPVQGRPVIVQAGVSPEGRETAARYADAIFSPFGDRAAGRAFFTDVKARVVAHGRQPDDLKIMPAATFALGDTHADAEERAAWERRQQVSPATAVRHIESVWGRRFDGLDVDGALPPLSDLVEGVELTAGRAKTHQDLRAKAAELHELAAANGYSVRDIVVETTTRSGLLVGTPDEVAAEIADRVQDEVCDGFTLVPSITPTGLDEFHATVVPLLQERGVYRTAYEGSTLRDRLATRSPAHAAG